MAKTTFTESDIITECKKLIKDPKNFYSEFKDRKSKTSDTQKYFSEVIAEFLLNKTNIIELKKIPIINRTISYKIDSHDPKNDKSCVFTNSDKRIEEAICKALFLNSALFNKTYNSIGKIIDFQTPLKDASSTKNVGKIDLLSYNHNDNIVYILENKKPDSDESVLRCILETYTYSKQVENNNLFNSFEISKDAKIIPSILIFEESSQYKELKDNNRSKVIELMKELKVKAFVIKGKLNIPITLKASKNTLKYNMFVNSTNNRIDIEEFEI